MTTESSSQIEAKLAEMGLALPTPLAPAGAYRGWIAVGDLYFFSGQGSEGHHGRVGESATEEDAYKATQACALSLLAQAKMAFGSLDNIEKIVEITGYINAVPEFEGVASALNGASHLFVEAFGEEIGAHARSAVGAGSLPFRILAEVSMIAKAKSA